MCLCTVHRIYENVQQKKREAKLLQTVAKFKCLEMLLTNQLHVRRS